MIIATGPKEKKALFLHPVKVIGLESRSTKPQIVKCKKKRMTLIVYNPKEKIQIGSSEAWFYREKRRRHIGNIYRKNISHTWHVKMHSSVGRA
jgi:hypothetical protein